MKKASGTSSTRKVVEEMEVFLHHDSARVRVGAAGVFLRFAEALVKENCSGHRRLPVENGRQQMQRLYVERWN